MQLVLFNPLIGPISGATISDQRGPGSNGNEGVLRIPKSSSITEALPSDCLVSYTLGVVLPLCRGAVGVFYSPNQLGKKVKDEYLKFLAMFWCFWKYRKISR